MTNIHRKIPPITDFDFYQAVLALDGKFPGAVLELSVPSFSKPFSEFGQSPQIAPVLDARGRLFSEFSCRLRHGSVTLRRATDPTNASSLDMLAVDVPDNPEHRGVVANHLSFLQNQLDTIAKVSLSPLLGDELRAHLEARDIALAKLETTAAVLVKDSEEAFLRRQELLTQREAKLDSDNDARRQLLNMEYSQKAEQLAIEKESLDKLRRELDDRAATHARRQHYSDMKSKLENWSKEFGVSSKTSRLRWWVIIPTVSLMVCFGGAAVYFLIEAMTTADTGTLIWVAAKQVAFTALFVATSSFFIRWANAWSSRHADEEFRLKRFDLDLARASWFVEMAFEWHDEKGGQLPTEIVDRLTRGLFTDAAADSPTTPAESLAHAMLGASQLSLQLPGGSRAEWEGRQMKELRKARGED